MPTSYLDLLLRNPDGVGFKLIPHVEELALEYLVANTVMASRVMVKTDMSGWNVRKVSQYLRGRRAKILEEDTDIPNTRLLRVRKAHIEPREVGDMYRVTNRRTSTDRESILRDSSLAIAQGIRERVEIDLMQLALGSFTGDTFGDSSTNYSLDLMLSAAMLFRARSAHGALHHVVHPFQVLAEARNLIQYSNATQQADLSYRDQAATLLRTADLRRFELPTFGVSDIVTAELLPRRVIYKLSIYGTGGTFRLQVGDDGVIGENITAAIAVTGTHATDAAAIETALNALDMSGYYSGSGTWDVTSTAMDNMTITPPSDFFIDDQSGLRPAIKQDEEATLPVFLGNIQEKDAYDLITGVTESALNEDKNGNFVGYRLFERSGEAKSLLFQDEALLWDIRQGIQANVERAKQGRTVEISGYMVYGASEWSPELGMIIHTKASSPKAVGNS